MPKDKTIPPKFDGTNIPDDFYFPSCGIEDMDKALFKLFDERLNFSVLVDDEPRKVPVVFATGERFALTRRKHPPIRDKNNAIILPIISIHRKNIDFSPNLGGKGTAISVRDQPSYTIRKKLSKKDRDYQNIVNKLRLKNQSNVASRANFLDNDIFPGNNAAVGKVASRKNLNNLSYIDDPKGNLLRDDIGNNIFEIITIPYPEFILSEYEITFWTQYTVHMNQIIESLVVRFDGQDKGFQIETDKGYKFVAFFDTTFNSGDNFDNFANEERIIRYTITVKVPGFILAPDLNDLPSPFKRFYSAPNIDFGMKQTSTQVVSDRQLEKGENNVDKFILSDVNLLNEYGEKIPMRDQTGERVLEVMKNPFTGEDERQFVRVITKHQRSGETVASSRIIVDLETVNDPSDGKTD